jgi:hypothetical protein
LHSPVSGVKAEGLIYQSYQEKSWGIFHDLIKPILGGFNNRLEETFTFHSWNLKMSKNAVSPLMPRSPSNQNIGSPSRTISQSLAMRKSISKPSVNGRPPETVPNSDLDYDMADIQNKAIADKYEKGKEFEIWSSMYSYWSKDVDIYVV